MKIMLVTPYFSPKTGGLENYALNIAENLLKAGDDIVVVTSNHQNKQYIDEQINGLRVIRLPITFRFSNTPVGFGWSQSLKKLMLTEKPDVINAHAPVPGLADLAVRVAYQLQIPTTLTYHAATLDKNGSALFKAVALVYSVVQKSTFKKATRIIAVSDYVKECMPVRYQAKTCVVYNAIDVNEIPRQKQIKQPHRLIFIGSLDRSHNWKGLSETLHAVALIKKIIPDIQLVVVGDGNMRATYEAEAENLAISENVSFMGNITGTKKYQLIQSASALIAYPTSRNDAFPTVFNEAWACKTVIVSADIGALTGILNGNDAGELIIPGRVDELANGIVELLHDKAKRAKYVKNGRRLVAVKFNWNVSSTQTKSVLQDSLRINVCMIHNVISPYRLPIFEAMNHEVNLHVVFPKSITKDRVWKFSLANFTFDHTVLRGRNLGPLILNANAISVMCKQRFNVLIVNNDPDVASLAIPAIVIAKLRGAKIINWSEVTSNNVDSINQIATSPKLRNRIITVLVRASVRRYRRIVLRASDHHIGFSMAAISYLHREDVDDRHITRTRLLMPQENLLPANARSYKKRTGKKILYLGYLNNRKGVDTLIKAFMKLPQQDTTLTIAGTGPLLDDLKKLAVTDSRIVFAGYVEGQDKANLYASSDIFVLPTLSDVWGLVIDEAIHYGLAVVCSTAAEAKELVDKSGGVLFPPQNVSALYAELDNLIENSQTVQAMQSHNIRRRHIAKRGKMADNIITAIRLVS